MDYQEVFTKLAFTGKQYKQGAEEWNSRKTGVLIWEVDLRVLTADGCLTTSAFYHLWKVMEMWKMLLKFGERQIWHKKSIELHAIQSHFGHGKIMEWVLWEHISEHKEGNKVTGNSQHRFTKDKPWLTNVIDCLLWWYQRMIAQGVLKWGPLPGRECET